MKTVRFTQVVQASGKPAVHAQWVALEKDAELKAAVKAGRVMTVHLQTTGTKKEHGEVGLVESGQRTLLIFPKPLKRFQGRRVVGIDYDLLDPGKRTRWKPVPIQKRAVGTAKAGSGGRGKTESPKKAAKEAIQAKRESASMKEMALRIFNANEDEDADGDTHDDREDATMTRKAKPKTKTAVKTSAPKGRTKKAAPARKTGSSRATSTKRGDDTGEAAHALRREIRKAMKQLQSGKAVAAYQTLEGALRE